MTADVDDDGERMVCAECIGEAFLSAGVTRRCGEAITGRERIRKRSADSKIDCCMLV